MKRLEMIKETLEDVLIAHKDNMHEVDTHEFGEVVDALKDICVAMYYCRKAYNEVDETKPM